MPVAHCGRTSTIEFGLGFIKVTLPTFFKNETLGLYESPVVVEATIPKRRLWKKQAAVSSRVNRLGQRFTFGLHSGKVEA